MRMAGHVNGQSSIVLDVKKRVGANILEVVASRAIIDAASKEIPGEVNVSYLFDDSKKPSALLGDLTNNVIAAVVIVMIVVVASSVCEMPFWLALLFRKLIGITVLSPWHYHEYHCAILTYFGGRCCRWRDCYN